MTEHNYDSEALRIAAWGDLRHYMQRPYIYQHHANLNQFFQSLWMVYLIRTGLFASFDDFHDEAKRRAAMFAKQLARGAK
jgi:hypothetical protein